MTDDVLARGELVMQEVEKRLRAAMHPVRTHEKAFLKLSRADANPAQEAAMPALTLMEPDEEYQELGTHTVRATMRLTMMCSVRQAVDEKKAREVRWVWLAAWKAMIPPEDTNLGGLVIKVKPSSLRMVLSKEPQVLSVAVFSWILVYDFHRDDPTQLP